MKLEYVNKKTGEIVNLKEYFNKGTDNSTRTSTNLHLNEDEVVLLRGTTNKLTTIQCTLGILTGVLLGKGLFTGLCIAIGSSIIYDAMTPTDFIYKQVLTSKKEKS